MKLTAKSAYAIRALHDLVVHSRGEPISISSISRRARISSAFLYHIFNRMRKKGLIKSVRGVNGGYILARSPRQIMIKDIIIALEGPLLLLSSKDNPGPRPKYLQPDNQALKIVWEKLGERITDYLSNTSLADVCQK